MTSRKSDNLVRFVDAPAGDSAVAPFSDEEQALLDRINRRVGARESLEDVLGFLAESLRPITPCDRFSLSFTDEHGRRVISRYTRAFYEPVLLETGYAEDLEGSSLQTVLRRGVPRIINDLPAYLAARPRSRSTKLLVREGVRSSLTCPLRVDDRNVALLFRSARAVGAYDDHQVRLHLAVAERLSQVVGQAWRLAQLAEANRAYFEMLGFVTHELKSPVAGMLTEAGLLVDGYVGPLAPPQRERLDKLMRKGRYLLDLVGDYLDLSRLEGGQLQAAFDENVDLVAAVVEPAIEVVSSQLEERGMILEHELPRDLPRLTCDPRLLKIVLVNLLSNAVKYGRERGRIRLVAECADHRLRVCVWNEGVGFPENQRDRLFRRFSRLQSPELLKRKGTGVGLYTAWRIVQLHRGRMDAASEEGHWAEFSFEIPLAPAAAENNATQ